MSALVPGVRVVVHDSGDHLTGQAGVIVVTPDDACGNWDHSVLLDKDLDYDHDTSALGFMSHELKPVTS